MTPRTGPRPPVELGNLPIGWVGTLGNRAAGVNESGGPSARTPYSRPASTIRRRNRWGRSSRGPVRQRVIGLGALGGLFGSEAMHAWLSSHYWGQGLACAAVAVAVPLLMARDMRERWWSLDVMAVASPVAYGLVYLPLDRISA